MRKLYNLLLAVASTSPMVLLFLVNANLKLVSALPILCTHILALGGVVAVNALGVFCFRFLSRDSIQGKLINIESASNSFLPNYLGYFFISVSITEVDTFLLVYGLTVLFVLLSQSMYYNPFLMLCGYHFYYATSENGTRVFLITRRQIRTVQEVGFPFIRRINDFTYIE